MKARTTALTLTLCLVGAAVCLGADDFMGNWKLNEGKSKVGAGMPKNSTVIYEAAGDSIKVTIDGTGGDGKPLHSEWTGKFDGKDYPVTGDPGTDMRSFKKIDDHTLMVTQKKGGNVTTTGKIVLSPDGKTRTVTASGTDASGKKCAARRCTTNSRCKISFRRRFSANQRLEANAHFLTFACKL